MKIITIIKIISCLLTIIGSLSIIFSYILFKSLRGRGREYLCYLSITNLGTAICYLILLEPNINDSNSFLCGLQSLLGIFFPVSSFCWTSCIGYYMYRLVVDLIPDNANSNKLKWIFHSICWIIPLISCIIVISFGQTGYYENDNNSGGWCWIKNSDHTLLWELIGGKFIELICVFIICPLIYYLVERNLNTIPRYFINIII